MLGKRVALVARAMRRAPTTGVTSTRSLYTDSIYPYPFNYINNVLYPSQVIYRENYLPPPWSRKTEVYSVWSMRVFWFYFFLSLFNDPGVIIGHHTFPDPTLWTDEELGIPPADFGSYEAWLESKRGEKE